MVRRAPAFQATAALVFMGISSIRSRNTVTPMAAVEAARLGAALAQVFRQR
jgi:hypothetical protein